MATLRQPPPRRLRPVRSSALAKPPAAAPPPPNRAKPAKLAPPPPEPAPAATASNPQSAGGALWVVGLGLILVACVVALPTVPIVVVGMIPTAVALFVDRDPHKTAAICVAGLNFAGVGPFIAVLWKGPDSLYHSMAILGDVYTWLAMYGAAALGWLLYLALPPLAASILRIRAAQQVAGLKAQQAKLREAWAITGKPAKR